MGEDAPPVAPESTVTLRTIDLLNGLETRLGSYIGDVEGRLTGVVGELRGVIGGLATKDDVRRLEAADAVQAGTLAAHAATLDAHGAAIGEIQSAEGVKEAVGKHKRSNWAIVGWSVATFFVGVGAVAGLIEALHSIGVL